MFDVKPPFGTSTSCNKVPVQVLPPFPGPVPANAHRGKQQAMAQVSGCLPSTREIEVGCCGLEQHSGTEPVDGKHFFCFVLSLYLSDK